MHMKSLLLGILDNPVMRLIEAIGSVEPMPMAPYSPRKHVKKYGVRRSKYMPHQGERECARRVRQMAKWAAA